MRTLDLNCDLGEGEPHARTRALMRWITSANVACGGHAGNVRSMRDCVRLARQFKVKLGAHPGPWCRADMGRHTVHLTPAELELLLLQQVSALEKIAASEGVRLHHIKLHGALYHAVETDGRLAMAYLRCVRQSWPDLAVYALANGRVVREAKRLRLKVFAEGFADRAYQSDGRLVPRNVPGALLDNPIESITRAREFLSGGGPFSIDGKRLTLKIETLCVHSDSPNSLKILRLLARLVR